MRCEDIIWAKFGLLSQLSVKCFGVLVFLCSKKGNILDNLAQKARTPKHYKIGVSANQKTKTSW